MTKNGLLTCDSFEDRVNELLDQRKSIADDNLLLKHSSQCDGCDQLLNDFVMFQDVPDFSGANSVGVSQTKPWRRWQVLSRPASVVAALAAMVFLLVGTFPQQHAPESGHARVSDNIANTPTSTTLASESNRGSFLEDIQPEIFGRVDDLVKWMPDFSVADKLPNLMPPIPTWQTISDGLDPLEPIIVYSYEIPGVRSARCTVDVTINWLRDSLAKPAANNEPDIGLRMALSLDSTA